MAARAARYDAHRAFRNTETLCNEIDQRAIGGILHGRCRNTNLDHTGVHSGKFGSGGTWLNIDIEANGWHAQVTHTQDTRFSMLRH